MIRTYTAILLVLFLPAALAQETAAVTEQGNDVNTPAKAEMESDTSWMTSSFNWLEEQRNFLSKQVTSTAKIMDEYIARDSFDDSLINESFLRVSLMEPLSSGYDYGPRLRVKARVDVPNSQKKVKVFFDTDPQDLSSIDDRRRANQGAGRSNTNNAVVGLSLFQKAGSTWNPNLNIGISNSPVELYTKVRVSRYDELPGPWQSRFNESLTYYDSRGFVSSTSYDVYRPLDQRRILRNSSEAQFNEQEENPGITEGEPLPLENYWEFYHGWSLYQQLNDQTSVEYIVATTALSKPSPRMENIWLSAEWRQLLYKDWLFGKITPEISFPRERDFSATYSVFFELEIYIGEHFKARKYEDL
jgi:hypothetical protein